MHNDVSITAPSSQIPGQREKFSCIQARIRKSDAKASRCGRQTATHGRSLPRWVIVRTSRVQSSIWQQSSFVMDSS